MRAVVPIHGAAEWCTPTTLTLLIHSRGSRRIHTLWFTEKLSIVLRGICCSCFFCYFDSCVWRLGPPFWCHFCPLIWTGAFSSISSFANVSGFRPCMSEKPSVAKDLDLFCLAGELLGLVGWRSELRVFPEPGNAMCIKSLYRQPTCARKRRMSLSRYA